MKKFTFYWRTGDREVLEGETPAHALDRAGYGGGAVRALDFFSYGDDRRWEWNAEVRDWFMIESEAKKLEEQP